ncbi:exodeoxyribonuclease VII small subunit [bacterium]|nr:exodeoxyribonuclease VII small subunit [bacterium]
MPDLFEKEIDWTPPADFEEGLNKLQNIVDALESGNLKLEEGIQIFKEATHLAKWCSEQLKEAENNIKVLIAEEGSFKLEEFEVEETED